jgi:hypothetical protein
MARFVVARKGKPVQAFVACLVALLTFGYMLPWAVAATRGKLNSGAIFWLNLLFGWTVIGWVIALVMSFSAHPVVAAPGR